jgi:hypothetical protein
MNFGPLAGMGTLKKKLTLVPFWGMETKKNTKKKMAPFGGWRTKKADSLQNFTPGTIPAGPDPVGSVWIGEKKETCVGSPPWNGLRWVSG